MGGLYGLSGFSHDGRGDDLSKNPRVKNLQWVVLVFFGLLIGNIQALSKQDIAVDERATLLADYVVCVIVGAILMIVATAAFIAITVVGRSKHNHTFQGRVVDLVNEYFQYGFKAYRARSDKIDDGDNSSTKGLPVSLGEFGRSLGAILAAPGVIRLDAQNPDRQDEWINIILDGIESVVKLFGSGVSDLEVVSNYMIVCSQPESIGDLMFHNGRPLTQFSSFLVFKRYKAKMGPGVCIPVEKMERKQWLLPGAPISVAETTACCINTKKLKFRNKVPPSVRREIETFFKAVSYESVLSVPIQRGRSVVGVVNIETNHLDVVGKGPSLVRELEKALAPFCIILGPLIAAG